MVKMRRAPKRRKPLSPLMARRRARARVLAVERECAEQITWLAAEHRRELELARSVAREGAALLGKYGLYGLALQLSDGNEASRVSRAEFFALTGDLAGACKTVGGINFSGDSLGRGASQEWLQVRVTNGEKVADVAITLDPRKESIS